MVKQKEAYQVVLDKRLSMPKVAEQVGDTGLLWFGEEKIPVLNTQKENDLIIHYIQRLPEKIDAPVRAEVNRTKRLLTKTTILPHICCMRPCARCWAITYSKKDPWSMTNTCVSTFLTSRR